MARAIFILVLVLNLSCSLKFLAFLLYCILNFKCIIRHEVAYSLFSQFNLVSFSYKVVYINNATDKMHS